MRGFVLSSSTHLRRDPGLPASGGSGARSCRLVGWVALLSVLLILAACSSIPEPPLTGTDDRDPGNRQLHWLPVELPQGAEPVTLSPSGSRLLVGAQVSSGRVRPRLFSIDPETSTSEAPTTDAAPLMTGIALTPQSPYAFLASWQSISGASEGDGGPIIAVGGARGGAHYNTRWTTWSGTPAGLTERPQTFGTFGGAGAGEVASAVVTSRGAALVGSWQSDDTGLDAAVWLPAGDRWVRQSSAGTALASTAQLLVGPRSATSDGPRIVVAGSATHLSPGSVRQSAAIWHSRELNEGWARLDLPESGTQSEAVSVSCAEQDCLLAGYVDQEYALWSTASLTATRLSGLPKIPVDLRANLPAPLLRGELFIGLVSSGPKSMVLTGDRQTWTLAEGPVGEALSSALAGHWLYVVAKPPNGPAVLWRTDADRLS